MPSPKGSRHAPDPPDQKNPGPRRALRRPRAHRGDHRRLRRRLRRLGVDVPGPDHRRQERPLLHHHDLRGPAGGQEARRQAHRQRLRPVGRRRAAPDHRLGRRHPPRRPADLPGRHRGPDPLAAADPERGHQGRPGRHRGQRRLDRGVADIVRQRGGRQDRGHLARPAHGRQGLGDRDQRQARRVHHRRAYQGLHRGDEGSPPRHHAAPGPLRQRPARHRRFADPVHPGRPPRPRRGLRRQHQHRPGHRHRAAGRGQAGQGQGRRLRRGARRDHRARQRHPGRAGRPGPRRHRPAGRRPGARRDRQEAGHRAHRHRHGGHHQGQHGPTRHQEVFLPGRLLIGGARSRVRSPPAIIDAGPRPAAAHRWSAGGRRRLPAQRRGGP
ncbi:putative Phosphoglucosamine mutase [Actinacidiphila bryophytorum]|uniref:Phosphoglucosamine mutase n=1 Tax=Actinacidiphila bryophytorum TaxID=1436133 RepID=A0A9W4H7D7_9ACTN|nr:putative Phosphoglucosamine mutase [Actinacidiphila bryophytorum]